MLQAAYPAICKQDMSMRKTVIPLVAFSLLAGCATSTIKGSADSHPPKQSPAQEAARTTLNQGIALYEMLRGKATTTPSMVTPPPRSTPTPRR